MPVRKMKSTQKKVNGGRVIQSNYFENKDNEGDDECGANRERDYIKEQHQKGREYEREGFFRQGTNYYRPRALHRVSMHASCAYCDPCRSDPFQG